MSASTRSCALPVLFAALTMVSCVSLQQYHPPAEPSAALPDAVCRPSTPGDCSAAVLEERDEYLLGFVEFDDLGWAWDRGQQELLLSRLEAETAERDALIVVFAHGWKHDARTCDTNVTCFRETLKQLYLTEMALVDKSTTPRRIIGIYLGWRGRSANGPVSKQLSFYGRKGTAHKVGSGAVTEFLVRLKEIRNQRHQTVAQSMTDLYPDLTADERPSSPTRLVFVGHSFGGALMYSATSQLLVERLALAAAYGDAARGFGDMVVLVNPAFEAARYEPLHEAVRHGAYPDDQRPILAIITSQGDSATGKAFPLGRWLPSQFDTYRKDSRKREQIGANRKAVGHFPDYRTHFLIPNDRTEEPVKANKKLAENCGCNFPIASEGTDEEHAAIVRETIENLRNHRWSESGEMSFPLSTLVWEKDKLPSNSPIMLVSADPKIIPNHSGIYQRAFIDFLRYMIMQAGEPVNYAAISTDRDQ